MGKGITGKGMLGKGITGKGITGKGMLGKGITGKGMLGKGIRNVGQGNVCCCLMLGDVAERCNPTAGSLGHGLFFAPIPLPIVWPGVALRCGRSLRGGVCVPARHRHGVERPEIAVASPRVRRFPRPALASMIRAGEPAEPLVMKFNELVRLLEANGFSLVREKGSVR